MESKNGTEIFIDICTVTSRRGHGSFFCGHKRRSHCQIQIIKTMTSTEEKITFEQMPQAVFEIKAEILGLKEIVRQALSHREEQTADRWMNLSQLCEYHPDHPAKSTIYEWVGQHRIPVHKSGKKLRFLRSEIDEWLCGGRSRTQEELEREAMEYVLGRKGGRK